MSRIMLQLNDLAPGGREYAFDDPDIWTGPWREFGLPYRMDEPLTASFRVTPEKGGFLVSGGLDGVVLVPCSRCSEDARVPVAARFTVFEEPPGPDADPLAGGHIERRGRTIELDVSALLWEQLELAMPVKPLCFPDCRGLCPDCGADLNASPCACAGGGEDPRLAKLRNLKIERK